MKKILIFLLFTAIVGTTYSQGPTEKAKYKMETKVVAKFLKLQDKDKGKLKSTFYKRHRKGIEKERTRFFYGSFGGPFHNGHHQGTQDYYNVDIYNGYNNLRMTLPIPFGGGSYYLFKELYLSDKNKTIKVLGYSHPIFTEQVTYGGITNEAVRKGYIDQGEDVSKDVFHSVYYAAFLPMEDFERQKDSLHQIALKECKEWKIKNIDDAVYYAWYYGKGNGRGYEYSEDVIKEGYPNIKPKNLPRFIELFYYSSIMPEVKADYINSLSDFEQLLLAYTKYPDANIDKNQIEAKLYGMIDNLSKINLFMRVFPDSKFKTQLDTKAYDIVSGTNTIPAFEKYLSIFPAGQKIADAKANIDRIKKEIEIARQKAIKARQEKIKNEGADGVYSEYSDREFGLLWGYYDEYHVEFNDSTRGVFYFVDDYYCLSTNMFGTNKIFYETKEDALKALYKYEKGEGVTDEGRYYPPVNYYDNSDYEQAREVEKKKNNEIFHGGFTQDYSDCIDDIELEVKEYKNPLFGKQCSGCVKYYAKGWFGSTSEYCILQDKDGKWWVENLLNWSGPYDTKTQAMIIQWCGGEMKKQ